MPKPESLLQQLLSYLKKPNIKSQDTEQPSLTFIQKVFNVIRLWGIEITFTMILGIILSVVLAIAKYDNSQHAISQLFESSSFWLVILLGGIYAPLTEELTFRLGLKYSPFRLSISITLLLSMMLQLLDFYKIVNYTWLFEYIHLDNPLLQGFVTLTMALFFGIVVGFFFKIPAINAKVSNLHTTYFIFIFYLSAILFGIIHASNYDGLTEIWYLIPILGLPQIFIGVILGYVRVNYGMIWSIILHSIHNTLAILPLFFFSIGSPALKNLVTDTTQNSATEIANSLTPVDSLLILITVFYILMLLLSILLIWVQVIYEFVKSRKW
jgi:hypothetical protein